MSKLTSRPYSLGLFTKLTCSWCAKRKVPSNLSLPRHPMQGESDGSTNKITANTEVVKGHSPLPPPSMPRQRTTKVHKFKSGPDSFIGSGLQCLVLRWIQLQAWLIFLAWLSPWARMPLGSFSSSSHSCRGNGLNIQAELFCLQQSPSDYKAALVTFYFFLIWPSPLKVVFCQYITLCLLTTQQQLRLAQYCH